MSWAPDLTSAPSQRACRQWRRSGTGSWCYVKISLGGLHSVCAVQELGATFDIGPIPEDMQAMAEEWREKLVDAAVEVDDEAMEAYLEGEVGFAQMPSV